MKIARELPAERRGERASELIKGTCVEAVLPSFCAPSRFLMGETQSALVVYMVGLWQTEMSKLGVLLSEKGKWESRIYRLMLLCL